VGQRKIADDPNSEGGQAVGSLGPTLAAFERPCTNRNESCRKSIKDNVEARLRQSLVAKISKEMLNQAWSVRTIRGNDRKLVLPLVEDQTDSGNLKYANKVSLFLLQPVVGNCTAQNWFGSPLPHLCGTGCGSIQKHSCC
jgi:hypothetical protein